MLLQLRHAGIGSRVEIGAVVRGQASADRVESLVVDHDHDEVGWAFRNYRGRLVLQRIATGCGIIRLRQWPA
jgi:hypothetical protein